MLSFMKLRSTPPKLRQQDPVQTARENFLKAVKPQDITDNTIRRLSMSMSLSGVFESELEKQVRHDRVKELCAQITTQKPYLQNALEKLLQDIEVAFEPKPTPAATKRLFTRASV